MWVFTKDGFFSAVEHRGDKRMVCVRARVRQDLVNLRAKLPGASRIVTTPDADYAFRVVVEKARWAGYVASAARDIDYDNFKNATTRDCAHRSNAYHCVWSAMERLQEMLLPASVARKRNASGGTLSDILDNLSNNAGDGSLDGGTDE